MSQPISKTLHEELVQKYFLPFHSQIKSQYEYFSSQGAQKIFHIDLHSMPSVGTMEHKDPGQRRADIVVSDCDGKSCAPWFKDLVIRAYEAAGFTVAYNWPYIGGRITETYGHPLKGQEAIQVEFNRALYMDEASKQLLKNQLPDVQKKLEKALYCIQKGLPEMRS